MKKRCNWIDFAKGITILLVIVGHTLPAKEGSTAGILWSMIFSFHMPLFFILSMITTKLSFDREQLILRAERSFQHLIIPAYLMFFLRSIYEYFQGFSSNASFHGTVRFVQKMIVTGTFASGMPGTIAGGEIAFFGVVWFTVALFFARTLYDYLHLKYGDRPAFFKGLLAVLCVIGVCIGRLQYLPLSFDIVLAVLPLLYVGTVFNQFKIEEKPILKLCVYSFTWLALFLISEFVFHEKAMSFAFRRYPLFPLCYVTAVFGTLMVSEFSYLLADLKISKPMLYLGKNSLYMLCIHMVDYSVTIWKVSSNVYIQCAVRIAMDVILFVIVMAIVEQIKKRKARKKQITAAV